MSAENYFADTFANLVFDKVPNKQGENEHPFISDLFNDKIAEVGHIQLIPNQNRLCITAGLNNEEQKIYYINEPRLEFLKFVFENSNRKVKKAIRFYFQNSPDARKQYKANQAKEAQMRVHADDEG